MKKNKKIRVLDAKKIYKYLDKMYDLAEVPDVSMYIDKITSNEVRSFILKLKNLIMDGKFDSKIDQDELHKPSLDEKIDLFREGD